MKVTPGDAITYVYEGDFVFVVRSFVTGGLRDGDEQFLTTNTAHNSLLSMRDEGTRWIRRHYDDNSEEVAALLAAYRLTASHSFTITLTPT
jgi:hypothetical protein